MNINIKNSPNFFLASIIVIILLFIGVIYFYKIAFFPIPDGDETGLLSIPFRLVNYGDYRYLIYGSESFNSHSIRLQPPLLTFSLRSIFHAVFGFGAALSRYFSASLILLISFLVAAVNYRWTRNKFLSLFVFSLSVTLPSFIIAARTVRFEQEVIFLGIAGCLLPLLFLKKEHKIKNQIVWIVSGFCISWAVNNHPYGLGFSLAILITIFFNRHSWHQLDNFYWLKRIYSLGIGAIFPIIINIIPILHNFREWRISTAAMSSFYAVHNMQMIKYFTDHFQSWYPHFMQILPKWLFADFVQLDLCSLFATPSQSLIRKILSLVFWISVFCAFTSIKRIYLLRHRVIYLPYTMGLVIFMIYLIISMVYSPSFNYFLYPTTGWVVFVGLAMAFPSRKFLQLKGILRFIPRILVIISCITLITSTFYSIQNFRQLYNLEPSNNPANLDLVYAEMIDLSNQLGLTEDKRPIYTDQLTWAIGGKFQASIWDVINYGKFRQAAATGFDPSFISHIIDFFPTYTQPQVSVLQKRKNFNNFIAQLRLSAVLIVNNPKSIHLIYSQPDLFNKHLRVTLVKNSYEVDRWKQAEIPLNQLNYATSSINEITWHDVKKGDYLIKLESKSDFHFEQREPYILSIDGKVIKDHKNNYLSQFQGMYGHRIILVNLHTSATELKLENVSDVGDAQLIPLAKKASF